MDERGVPRDIIREYFKPSGDFIPRLENHKIHQLEKGRDYKNSKTGEEVSPQDVYSEFNTEVADRHKIMKFKTKVKGINGRAFIAIVRKDAKII